MLTCGYECKTNPKRKATKSHGFDQLAWMLLHVEPIFPSINGLALGSRIQVAPSRNGKEGDGFIHRIGRSIIIFQMASISFSF
jgi:hypothetical protein